MRIHLGGYLSFFSAGRTDLDVPVPEPARLRDVLLGLGLPPGEVYLAVVNSQLVDPADAFVSDQDEVKLYPPVDGGHDMSCPY